MDQTDRQNAGSATLFRRLCMIPMGLALLSGCGGGGGGSGIQSPPVTHDAARVGTPHSPLIWITDSDEFNAQKGLSVIQSSAAYLVNKIGCLTIILQLLIGFITVISF